MVLGMSLHAFTVLHVAITLVELLAGLLVVAALLGGKKSALSGLFLVTAALTSITGFLFPFHGVTPGIILGVLALVTTALAAVAGGHRKLFAIAAVITLYFDAFVTIAQLFEHVPSLHALAPTGGGPVFGGAQGVLLIVFVVLGVKATKGYSAA
jgi:hypothetical protein